MQHTPGPWMGHSKNGRIVMAGDTKVATAERTVNPPEAFTNAKLIAAAPELLEACKAVLQYLEQYADPGSNVLWGTVTAAIRKAEDNNA